MIKFKHTLSFGLMLASHILFAQVHIVTEPDFPFDGTELTALLTTHVANVQAAETLRVPDSVIFAVEINNDGSLKTATELHAYSASHAAGLRDLLTKTTFKGLKGPLHLAVIYPPLADVAYPFYALTGVPETQVCNDYDSKNETFRLACFTYLNKENLRNIAGPDSVQLMTIEGKVDASIRVGIDGHVEQVTFKRPSFNPELNDLIVDQLAEIQFLDGGFVGKRQVSYLVPYQESFSYLVPGSEVAYLDRALADYQNKAYYPCTFMLMKAKQLGYKFTKPDVNLMASAYLLAGDSASAFNWWRDNFEPKALEGMKMVPKKVGDLYEVELVEYVREKDESGKAMPYALVEGKPVYPGCEDLENAEEQFNCFNRSIMTHVAKSFKFPEVARQRGIQGRMFITFVIEKDGQISTVEMARGVHPLLDLEGLRVVCLIPKMQPAFQRDKKVRMQYTVPINAKLQ